MKIIAELCQNHNGSEELMLKMIDEAAEGGAKFIKIQHIYSENLSFRPVFDTGSPPLYIKRPYNDEYNRLKNLDSSMLAKDYYFQLSHIIREFLENKFYIRTLEMTTQEIISSKKIFPIDDDVFSDLVQFLSEADKVKYARVIPDAAKIRTHKNTIETFIDIL